jgi:hypothetical protein
MVVVVALLAVGLGFAVWGQTWAQSVVDWLACAEQSRASEELEQRSNAIKARIEKKQAVVDKVIARRMGLLEAAAHFGALNHESPGFCWETYRQVTPGKSDEERFCREVILAIEVHLHHFHPSGQVLCSRLRSELKDHLRREPLRLPDVSSK